MPGFLNESELLVLKLLDKIGFLMSEHLNELDLWKQAFRNGRGK